jgi:hypothetical protein
VKQQQIGFGFECKKMTCKGKTITRHQRGNWYVKIRHNGTVITIYGKTQIQAYDKLKNLVDKLEQETISKKFLSKVESLGTQVENTRFAYFSDFYFFPLLLNNFARLLAQDINIVPIIEEATPIIISNKTL